MANHRLQNNRGMEEDPEAVLLRVTVVGLQLRDARVKQQVIAYGIYLAKMELRIPSLSKPPEGRDQYPASIG